MPVQPRILIAEDDAFTALTLQTLVADMGLSVCGVASTGPRAVALADHFRPDLVLVDDKLAKGTDGVVAARQMRRQLRLNVIMVSSSPPDDDLDVEVADLPWLRKPFAPGEVQAVIRAALDRHMEPQAQRYLPRVPLLALPAAPPPL